MVARWSRWRKRRRRRRRGKDKREETCKILKDPARGFGRGGRGEGIWLFVRILNMAGGNPEIHAIRNPERS